jgi:uncharacterized protein (TIGR02145 family)
LWAKNIEKNTKHKFMKRLLNFSLLSLLIFSLLLSCKKSNNDNSMKLSFKRTSYAPHEYAVIAASGLNLSAATYEGTIDENTTVTLTREDTVLVLMIPELAAGTHSLKLTINEVEYEATYNSTATISIADPNPIINAAVTDYNDQLNVLNQMLDSLSGADSTTLLSDLQIIQGYIDDANQLLASATAEEKAYAAQVLAANAWWMEELKTAIQNLTVAAGQLKANGVDNHEANVTEAMQNFVAAKIAVIEHVPKIAAWAAGGFAVGAGVGAAIGAGIAIGNLLSDLSELNLSIDEIVDISFLPFQNMFAERPVGTAGVAGNMEQNVNAKTLQSSATPVQFTIGQARSLTVTQEYRSPYNGDANNTTPIMRSFVETTNTIKAEWDNLMSFLPTSLSFGPPTVDGISSYSTDNKQVHSNYLSISNVSNSALTYIIDKTDGYFNVTFNGTVTGTQNFTFVVNYSNADFGSQSYTVNATISGQAGTFTDPRDGQVYQLVTIGSQTWFAENLRYNAAGSWYNPSNPDPKYGRLYDWNTAFTACPAGWHLPTDAEWNTLEMALGLSASDANLSGQYRGTHGTVMKSTTGWIGNGDNSSGFNAFPAGFYYSGSYYYLGDVAHFWSASEYDATNAWFRYLTNGNAGVGR